MNYFFVVQARMVRMTALDIQVSLRNEMANLSVFSSNMAACENPPLLERCFEWNIITLPVVKFPVSHKLPRETICPGPFLNISAITMGYGCLPGIITEIFRTCI